MWPKLWMNTQYIIGAEQKRTGGAMLKTERRRTYRPDYTQVRGLLDMIIDFPLWMKDKPMIEVGSYAGDSTLMFSLFFGEILSIDPHYPDNVNHTRHEDVMHDFTNNIFGRNIKAMVCTSDEAFSNPDLRALLPEWVSMAYIDGNHNIEYVRRDIKNLWPLICEGGFLCGHDYGLVMGGQDGVEPAVKEAFGHADRVYVDGSWVVQKTKGREYNIK